MNTTLRIEATWEDCVVLKVKENRALGSYWSRMGSEGNTDVNRLSEPDELILSEVQTGVFLRRLFFSEGILLDVPHTWTKSRNILDLIPKNKINVNWKCVQDIRRVTDSTAKFRSPVSFISTQSNS